MCVWAATFFAKVLPVCNTAPCTAEGRVHCPCDLKVNYSGDRRNSLEGARCEALRFALFSSEAAMRALEDAPEK